MSQYNFVDVPAGMSVQQIVDLKLPIRIKDLSLFDPDTDPGIVEEMYELSGNVFHAEEYQKEKHYEWFYLHTVSWSVSLDWVEIPDLGISQTAPTLNETVILNGDKVVLK